MGAKNQPINGISTYPGPEQSRVCNPQRLNPGHTPTQISSQPKIRDARISPDGKLILYQVTQFYRSAERNLSELWLAEIDKRHSSIKLTNGEFNDRSGVFHPDGTRILFLSDRQVPGKSTFIYSLALDKQISQSASGHCLDNHHEDPSNAKSNDDAKMKSEPRILTSKFSKQAVRGFEISPDGEWVAFTSVDESSLEDLRKVQEKNDAKVIGSKDGLSRLRVYNFESDEIRTLNNIPDDKQIEGFSWSPDSQEILYRLRENKGTEWTEFQVFLQSISVTEDSRPKSLGSYPRSPSGSNIWSSSRHIRTTNLRTPSMHVHYTFVTIIVMILPWNPNIKRMYEVHGDAVRMLGADNSHTGDVKREGRSFLAIKVSHDTDSRIDIIAFASDASCHVHKFTSSDVIWFNSWDVKCINTSSINDITYVFAGVLSSEPRHEPPNVWAGSITIRSAFNHLEWLIKEPILKTVIITWKTNDGVELSGLVRFPPGYDPSSPSNRLPTILFLNRSPCRRDIPDYMPCFYNWRELCPSAGYLTNYRGSQGRGYSFATTANAGIGVDDWPDCESMVDE